MKLYQLIGYTRNGDISKLVACKDEKELDQKKIEFDNFCGYSYGGIHAWEITEIDGYEIKLFKKKGK